jgi:hypothetical protein
MDHQTQMSQQTVKMPIDLETIEAIKKLCMVNFYTPTSQDISELGNIHFDYDGSTHWVCSRTIPRPLKVRDAGIIFEVYGKVSASDCQLFERRGEERGFEDEDILASCWIEPCSDALQERTHWRNFQHSLEDIISATGRSLNTTNLYAFDRETKVMRLKVVWAAVPGWREFVCGLHETPFFPSFANKKQVDNSARLPTFHKGCPCTIASVMDGKKVQVLFHLRHGSARCGQRYLHAALILIATDGEHGN